MARGRSSLRGQRRDPGRDLHDYFLHAAEERAKGDLPGTMAGEFLGKVHERYILGRGDQERPPFRMRGTGANSTAGGYAIGEAPPPKMVLVRPVYVPPPLAH